MSEETAFEPTNENEVETSSTEETITAEEKEQQLDAEHPELSDEQKERIIQEAIRDGKVVDYETRFKPIYGALKNKERELEAVRQSDKPKNEIPAAGPKPKYDDYDDYGEYFEALSDWKVSQLKAEQEQERRHRQQMEAQRKWDDQVSAAMSKDPQFLDRAYIPTDLVPFLDGSDHIANFGYFFFENPGEAQRIQGLPPGLAAREIGKLEAKFETQPPPRTETRAPSPTKPVGSKETPAKKPEDMSTAEYIAWRDKQEGLT